MVAFNEWYEVDGNGNPVRVNGKTQPGPEHKRRNNVKQQYIEEHKFELLQWAAENGLSSNDKDFLLAEVLSRKILLKAIKQHYGNLPKLNIVIPEMYCHYDLSVNKVPIEGKFKQNDYDQWEYEYVSMKKGEYLKLIDENSLVGIPHWCGTVSVYRLEDMEPPKDNWTHSATTARETDNNVTEVALVFKRSKALWTEKIEMPFK